MKTPPEGLFWFVLMMGTAGAGLALSYGISACSTVRDAQRIEEMTDGELALFSQRTAYQLATIASAAVAEGDLSREACLATAKAFESLANGSVAGVAGSLAGEVGTDGYGAAALALAVTELDATLQAAGAFEPGGVLSERARGVMQAIADALTKVATKE